MVLRMRAQLAGRGVIDDVFALCFGSVEGDGALMLGDVEAVGLGGDAPVDLAFTALLSSLAHPHYYSVRLESLWVGDRQLPVRPVRACCIHCMQMSRGFMPCMRQEPCWTRGVGGSPGGWRLPQHAGSNRG